MSNEDSVRPRATIQATDELISKPDTVKKRLPKSSEPSSLSQEVSGNNDSRTQSRLPRIELPEEVTGLFHRNYERILVDFSVSDKDVVLLAMYLLERENKIHDRYLITCDKCWSFGASIKDLGNEDTTIREISEVVDSMKDMFSERWDESPDLII